MATTRARVEARSSGLSPAGEGGALRRSPVGVARGWYLPVRADQRRGQRRHLHSSTATSRSGSRSLSRPAGYLGARSAGDCAGTAVNELPRRARHAHRSARPRAIPRAPASGRGPPRRWSTCPGRWRSSTSTGSRRSTTPLATTTATIADRVPSGWRDPRPATPWPPRRRRVRHRASRRRRPGAELARLREVIGAKSTSAVSRCRSKRASATRSPPTTAPRSRPAAAGRRRHVRRERAPRRRRPLRPAHDHYDAANARAHRRAAARHRQDQLVAPLPAEDDVGRRPGGRGRERLVRLAASTQQSTNVVFGW